MALRSVRGNVMRVAQICTNAMSGSVGSIARNICDGLIENGDECMICYGRGNVPEGYNSYKFDNKLDVYWHVAMARLFDSDGLHSKMATKRLIKKLNEFKPEIVHIHCLHGYYINYPMLFKYFEESGVKVVWTMHDCWAFTGHCCYYDFVGCNKWKNGCYKCTQKKNYPKSILSDRSARNYRIKKRTFTKLDNMLIITPSKWLQKEINLSFLKEISVDVINNGINTNIFKRKEIKKENIILGVASIWDQRKGLDDFVELSKVLPDDYRIMIVGADKQQQQMLENLNIQSISRTENIEELVNIYNKALVLFNPTYEDNYPTVNLEANSCGLPVITYDTGGAAEAIIYGEIIEKKDYKKIVSVVNNLCFSVNIKEKKLAMNIAYLEKYNKLFKELL